MPQRRRKSKGRSSETPSLFSIRPACESPHAPSMVKVPVSVAAKDARKSSSRDIIMVGSPSISRHSCLCVRRFRPIRRSRPSHYLFFIFTLSESIIEVSDGHSFVTVTRRNSISFPLLVLFFDIPELKIDFIVK